MARDGNMKCQHCGALGADSYANDGALVCDACAAYDQIVMSELRVSQADLHVVPTGEADHLAEAARRAARARVAVAAVIVVASLVTLVYGFGIELSYFASGIGLFLATILLVDARRLTRFAKLDAPEIERRATSSPPASMFESPSAHTTHT
jgi:hypothetical protein